MVLPCWFRRRSGGWALGPGTTSLRVRHEKRNSQNEPGMCLGINRLTFWCGPQTRSPRLAHIAKSAMYAPPEAGFGCASAPNRGNEAGMCPGINRFTKYAPVADWCVGEYLYGAPVLVPAALPWVGPELR